MANFCYALYKSGDLNYGSLPMLFGMQLRNYDERVFDGFLESLKKYDVEGIVAAGEAVAERIKKLIESEGDNLTDDYKAVLNAFVEAEDDDAFHRARREFNDRKWRDVNSLLYGADRDLYDFLAKKPIC